jgi:hypothetical protein
MQVHPDLRFQIANESTDSVLGFSIAHNSVHIILKINNTLDGKELFVKVQQVIDNKSKRPTQGTSYWLSEVVQLE